MKKDRIIQQLRQHGFRMTKQRTIILDIVLQEQCTCCKEIYYEAIKQDAGIGAATVYRMLGVLEEIGAINRKTIYRVECK